MFIANMIIVFKVSDNVLSEKTSHHYFGKGGRTKQSRGEDSTKPFVYINKDIRSQGSFVKKSREGV